MIENGQPIPQTFVYNHVDEGNVVNSYLRIKGIDSILQLKIHDYYNISNKDLLVE